MDIPPLLPSVGEPQRISGAYVALLKKFIGRWNQAEPSRVMLLNWLDAASAPRDGTKPTKLTESS
jgi:hypothetical protein